MPPKKIDVAVGFEIIRPHRHRLLQSLHPFVDERAPFIDGQLLVLERPLPAEHSQGIPRLRILRFGLHGPGLEPLASLFEIVGLGVYDSDGLEILAVLGILPEFFFVEGDRLIIALSLHIGVHEEVFRSFVTWDELQVAT